MEYKAVKCKCCGVNFSLVSWVHIRTLGFCSTSHAEKYIIDGFTKLATTP